MDYKVKEVGLYFIKESEEIVIKSSLTIQDNIFKFYDHITFDHKETFVVIALDNNNQVLNYKRFHGVVSACLVDVKQIFQFALLSNATGLILSHNHPSGKLIPSEADKNLTKQIVKAGQIMNVTILDHIIVTRNGQFSFANEGLL